ncbi:hypothetical protein B0H14DRAFT_3516062 [Mycena olivaceomarginata]|nr:hypothetical protein B0H14DRAFT_3516062 [Mycena olivaceomarginata]
MGERSRGGHPRLCVAARLTPPSRFTDNLIVHGAKRAALRVHVARNRGAAGRRRSGGGRAIASSARPCEMTPKRWQQARASIILFEGRGEGMREGAVPGRGFLRRRGFFFPSRPSSLISCRPAADRQHGAYPFRHKRRRSQREGVEHRRHDVLRDHVAVRSSPRAEAAHKRSGLELVSAERGVQERSPNTRVCGIRRIQQKVEITDECEAGEVGLSAGVLTVYHARPNDRAGVPGEV